MNKFSTLEEALRSFKRNALSEFVPPGTMKAIEGGFYAGAQATLTLLAEALELTPTICNPKVISIFAECQTFFELQKAAVDSKQKEGKKK